MSKNRLLDRPLCINTKPNWALKSIEPSETGLTGTLVTKAVPVGVSLDTVQLYAYHNINGRINFTCDADIKRFPAATGAPLELDEANGYALGTDDIGVSNPAIFQVENTAWNQPLDATKVISIKIPYFKVHNEFAYQMLRVEFNYGGDKGGGDNYALLRVQPDTSTGHPNENNLDFLLTYVNYGVTQDTDSYSGLRKYPDYTGDDLGYELQFWLDDSTNRAYVKIIPDEGAEDTLYVTSPTDLTYCDTHTWNLQLLFNDPATAETAIDWFRIVKGAAESDRLTYKISRDGGTTWTSVVGDDWFEEGYNTTSVDISAQPAGNKTLTMKVELRWPAQSAGFGAAFGGS